MRLVISGLLFAFSSVSFAGSYCCHNCGFKSICDVNLTPQPICDERFAYTPEKRDEYYQAEDRAREAETKSRSDSNKKTREIKQQPSQPYASQLPPPAPAPAPEAVTPKPLTVPESVAPKPLTAPEPATKSFTGPQSVAPQPSTPPEQLSPKPITSPSHITPPAPHLAPKPASTTELLSPQPIAPQPNVAPEPQKPS